MVRCYAYAVASVERLPYLLQVVVDLAGQPFPFIES